MIRVVGKIKIKQLNTTYITNIVFWHISAIHFWHLYIKLYFINSDLKKFILQIQWTESNDHILEEPVSTPDDNTLEKKITFHRFFFEIILYIYFKPGTLGDWTKPMMIQLDSDLSVGCQCHRLSVTGNISGIIPKPTMLPNSQSMTPMTTKS